LAGADNRRLRREAEETQEAFVSQFAELNQESLARVRQVADWDQQRVQQIEERDEQIATLDEQIATLDEQIATLENDFRLFQEATLQHEEIERVTHQNREERERITLHHALADIDRTRRDNEVLTTRLQTEAAETGRRREQFDRVQGQLEGVQGQLDGVQGQLVAERNQLEAERKRIKLLVQNMTRMQKDKARLETENERIRNELAVRNKEYEDLFLDPP